MSVYGITPQQTISDNDFIIYSYIPFDATIVDVIIEPIFDLNINGYGSNISFTNMITSYSLYIVYTVDNINNTNGDECLPLQIIQSQYPMDGIYLGALPQFNKVIVYQPTEEQSINIKLKQLNL